MDFRRRRFILIADDNHDLALSLSLLLKLVGFDVQTVHDGHAAVAAARDRRPDTLLLDIGLPGLDGFQVASVLRSDARLKDALIIAISGYTPGMLPGRTEWAAFDRELLRGANGPLPTVAFASRS